MKVEISVDFCTFNLTNKLSFVLCFFSSGVHCQSGEGIFLSFVSEVTGYADTLFLPCVINCNLWPKFSHTGFCSFMN